MPNIKSSKKRVLVNEAKKEENKMVKSKMKTVIKVAVKAVDSADVKEKALAESNAFSAIDKAAGKNVIHKNTASRKKAQIAKALNKKA